MTIKNVLASVAVRDLESSIQWYEKFFGKPPDSTLMSEVAEWKSPGGGWLQVYLAPERAGSTSCTSAISNLDEEGRRLEKLGIDVGKRTSSPQVKTIMIKDPDGNSIALAEAFDPSIAA